MPTTRETILAALYARLQPLAASVLRDEVLPERIPPAGLIMLRDGQPGEPEVTLSLLRHVAEVRSMTHFLNQPVGRTYQYYCDAELGDARCGVDLAAPSYSGSGSVAAVTRDRTFTTVGLGGFAEVVRAEPGGMDQWRQCRAARRGVDPCCRGGFGTDHPDRGPGAGDRPG